MRSYRNARPSCCRLEKGFFGVISKYTTAGRLRNFRQEYEFSRATAATFPAGRSVRLSRYDPPQIEHVSLLIEVFVSVVDFPGYPLGSEIQLSTDDESGDAKPAHFGCRRAA